MKKIIPALGVAAIAVSGYFGLNAAGIIGGPAKLTEQQLTDGLASYAEKINVDGGVSFDSWSRLEKAVAVQKTITIYGRSSQKLADLNDAYHSSRIAQATNKLCRDAISRNLLRSGARFQYNWLSADNESIGETIRFQDGDDVCGDIPIPAST